MGLSLRNPTTVHRHIRALATAGCHWEHHVEILREHEAGTVDHKHAAAEAVVEESHTVVKDSAAGHQIRGHHVVFHVLGCISFGHEEI